MGGILPPTTHEQRFRFYEDTETLLYSGFLTHTVVVNGVRIALRSLNPGDLFLLRARIGKGTERDWQIWTVASSVWVIDGYCLLGQPNAAPKIAQAVRSLPPLGREILFSVVMGLFARMSRAIDSVEAYSYESVSRFKWKGLVGGRNIAGIPGAEGLGQNYLQQMWTFFNEIEDQRLRDEALWEGFKLSVSPHSPKGIKKIDERDAQRKRDEMSRRQAVMDRFYYERVGILQPRKKGDRKSYDQFQLPSKTVEDLEAEMYRWVSGEEDEHDKIVKAYKKYVTDRYEAEKKAQEERAAAIRAAQERIEAEGVPRKLVAYTPEQLEDMLKGRFSGPSGVRQIHEDNSDREKLYSRYLAREPVAGALRTEDGRLVAEMPSNIPQEALMELLMQRQVPYSAGEEESYADEP